MRTKLRRLREIWAELGYAQRRLLEIQTGLELVTPGERARFAPHGSARPRREAEGARRGAARTS